MAKLEGVKVIPARIEFNGVQYEKVNRSARPGDIIKITDEDAQELDYITRDGFYVVNLVGRFGDVLITDDDGDEIDARGWVFEVYTKVSEGTNLPRPKVGDFARVVSNNSGHSANIGDIVKIVEDDGTSTPFRCTYADGTEIYCSDWFMEDDLEVISYKEAKWARIGRKVNEYKVGDLVRVIDSKNGHPHGTIGTVVEVDGTPEPCVEANGKSFWAGVELIVPVEQRFDKAE